MVYVDSQNLQVHQKSKNNIIRLGMKFPFLSDCQNDSRLQNSQRLSDPMITLLV